MTENSNAPIEPGSPAAPAAPVVPTERRSFGRRLRWPLLIAGPLLVLAIGGYVWLNSGRYAETDNAYIKADTLVVSPAVAGIVTMIAVTENQVVKAGDILFQIDPESYRLARDRSQSQLEAVQSYIEGLQATYRQALGQLELAQTDVRYAERDVERERVLAERGLGSESDLDEAQHTLDSAKQQIPIIDQRLAQLRAQLGGGAHVGVEDNAAYRAAKAALDNADIELQRTTVRAPIDGVVSHVPLAGIYASPGAPIMSLVSSRNVWVEANFKETQLGHVAVGQPVLIHVDTYNGEDWTGRVESISPATGAEFSVIPPQNASGNWVKVAQRIPVRIQLDAPAGNEQLRAGMSAVVEIDTGYERTAPLFLGFLQQHRAPSY